MAQIILFTGSLEAYPNVHPTRAALREEDGSRALDDDNGTASMIETIFRTTDVPAADRFDHWRELMYHAHAPMDMTSEHAADFRAEQRLLELGPVYVWPATFEQITFRRTPRLIRQSDPEKYHISLMLRGTAGITWSREETSVRTYDLHNNESSRPYEIRTIGQIRTIGLDIPKALLPLRPNTSDRAIGRPISGRDGIGALVALFLNHLASDTSRYTSTDGPRLGLVIVDLVSAMFAHVVDAEGLLPPETRGRTLALRVQAFIQHHLHEPELCPSAIAAAHHISLGYLHRLFRERGTTVSAWIQTQRLERCRRDLADPAMHDTPIHTIALRRGFTHAGQFSRIFRRTYDMTPTEYRNNALGSGA